MFFTCASMARSYDSKATPCTASRSCPRVKTRPGSRAMVSNSWNSVGVRSTGLPPPVTPRQPEVQNDQIRLRSPRAGQGSPALCGHDHLEPRDLEVVAHQPGDLHLVLDDQDGLHRRVPRKGDEAAGRRQAPPPHPTRSWAQTLAGSPPAEVWSPCSCWRRCHSSNRLGPSVPHEPPAENPWPCPPHRRPHANRARAKIPKKNSGNRNSPNGKKP